MATPETFWERCDRRVEKFEVIVGVVRAGVSGSQDSGEEFVCFVAPNSERMEPEPPLVRRRRILFVGMRGLSVASKSNVTCFRSTLAAAQSQARAAVTATGIVRCSTDMILSITRHAVGRDATGPNNFALCTYHCDV